jgi:hypothetical protein
LRSIAITVPNGYEILNLSVMKVMLLALDQRTSVGRARFFALSSIAQTTLAQDPDSIRTRP